MDEKLILSIHFSKTGLPSDQIYIGTISATNDLTLNQLKQQIIESQIIKELPQDLV